MNHRAEAGFDAFICSVTCVNVFTVRGAHDHCRIFGSLDLMTSSPRPHTTTEVGYAAGISDGKQREISRDCTLRVAIALRAVARCRENPSAPMRPPRSSPKRW